MKARVYLAGPEVFLRNALEIGDRKKDICDRYALEGVFPLDNDLDLEGLSSETAGLRIYNENRSLLESCDLLIANMTPFRGVSLDAGTAFEIGFMRGLMRPVLGYSNVNALYRTRVERFFERKSSVRHGIPTDPRGLAIEDFGLADNLMLEGAIREFTSGVVCKAVADEDLYTDLEAFEVCVAEAEQICRDRLIASPTSLTG